MYLWVKLQIYKRKSASGSNLPSLIYPKSFKVKVGDKVDHFTEIAGVGTTGHSTGNHLHWQVSVDGNKIDGMNLVDFNLCN